MKERSELDERTSRRKALRLAMAAVSLGMCIGITPGTVLGFSAQPEQTKDGYFSGSQQPGGAFIKFDGIDGEAQDSAVSTIQPAERPAAVFPKVEHPAAVFPKVEQPAAAFPKSELHRPAAKFPKVD
jgi:hypothetical protein